MGRYSSVQAYADNNANVRSISYDQATGGKGAVLANQKVTAEKVVNPYGSTAGAGSGEFHVYRHARAREMARWKELDAQEAQEKAEETFTSQLQADQSKEAEKTARRRKKRQREKEAKLRKKNLKASGILDRLAEQDEEDGPLPNSAAKVNADEEFTYIPLAEQTKLEEEENKKKKAKTEPGTDELLESHEAVADSKEPSDAAPADPAEAFPNDGSFLEMIAKKLAEETQTKSSASAGNTSAEASKEHSAPVQTRIIDEDEEEGPMLPPGF